MGRLYRQQGMALVVSLLLLIAVTVLVVSSIRMGMVNLRIVDNMQSQQATKSIAEDRANVVLGNIDNFEDGGKDLNKTVEGLDVAVSDRTCIGSRPASGYSARSGVQIIPEDNTWEFTTTINDGVNGTTAALTVGAEIRMVPDSC